MEHITRRVFVYIWGKQIRGLALRADMPVVDVTTWLYDDYVNNRKSDEVHKSLGAFAAKFL